MTEIRKPHASQNTTVEILGGPQAPYHKPVSLSQIKLPPPTNKEAQKGPRNDYSPFERDSLSSHISYSLNSYVVSLRSEPKVCRRLSRNTGGRGISGTLKFKVFGIPRGSTNNKNP